MSRLPLNISDWPAIHMLAPHPDDAGFSCPALLKQAAAAGLTITLQTLFDQSSYDASKAGLPAEAVTQLRAQEDQAFARYLGENCQLIQAGLPEAYSRKQGFDDILSGQYDTGDQEMMPRLLQAIMDHWHPESTLLAPMGLGNHVDHLLVRDAAIALARHHQSPLFLYEDLPYAAGAPEQELTDLMGNLGQAIGFTALPHLFITKDIRHLKEAGATCYPSQLQGDSLERILARTAELSGEGYWRLVWKG